MIRNIIFDMGGVLIRWNPEEMLQQFGLPETDRALLRQELFLGVEWIQMDRGILDKEQAIKQVCGRLPDNLHELVKQIVEGWFDSYLIPMPGMAELVRELKCNGYRIFLLSNASHTLRSYFSRIPGAECFESLMVSAEEQYLKPQHEIYECLYRKFALNPAECWFIDDSPANVEGAILTGMQASVFLGDVTRLRRQLHQAGIRCAERMD